MKNKKLFAILTLVCFMMTLMPVAAFAAQTPGVANDGNSYAFTNDDELDTITADAITAGEAESPANIKAVISISVIAR